MIAGVALGRRVINQTGHVHASELAPSRVCPCVCKYDQQCCVL